MDPGAKIAVNTDLLSFLKDHGCNRMQFRLLCFWSRHPRAKLSLYTLSHALHASGHALKEAITALVQTGILVAAQSSGGLTTYTLSQLECQIYIKEIERMDWTSLKKLELELENNGGKI